MPPSDSQPPMQAYASGQGDFPLDTLTSPITTGDVGGAMVPETLPAPGGSALPPSASPNLGTLLNAFRRAWPIAIPAGILGALATLALAWFLIPPQFTSSMVFRIHSRPNQGSVEDEGNFANVQKAQVSQLKSQDVLSDAITKSQVAEKYGWRLNPQKLSKLLITNFNEGPEILNVILAGDNPEAVAAVLNALGVAYPNKVNTMDEERVRQRIAILRKRHHPGGTDRDPNRVSTLGEQLRDKRIELAKAEKDHGLDDSRSVQAKYQTAEMMHQNTQREYREKKLGVDSLLAELQSKEERLKNPPQPQITDADIEEAIRADPAYMELLKEITVKRRKVDDIRRNAADRVRDSLLKGPVLELRRLEAERKHMIELGRDKLTSRVMNQQKETLQFEIRNIKDRLDQTKKQRDFLEGEVRRWAIEAETFRQGGPKAPPEVEALRDQVKQIEKEYNKVGDELASLEGSLPLPPRISVHAPAFIPTEKDYGRLMKFGLAGSLLAFCGLVAGICLLEARGQRIYTSEDLSQNLGMRVVGTLPYLSSAGRKQLTQNQSLGGLTGPFSLLESIDSIRTILQHSPGMEKARVILVTSATGHEGKTTLASQLAASLARSWRKTLLIDGDLRNPSQQVVFDQQLEPGLCECLRGEVEFEDAIKTTATSRLWLLPAGHVDPHALQALTQEGLTEIFKKFRENFEYIVVDTSPILPVSDGLMLAKRADVVLLSVMRDRSRIPAVFQAQQRLDSLNIKVLGCVVIGEKAETYGVSVKYPRTTT